MRAVIGQVPLGIYLCLICADLRKCSACGAHLDAVI